MKAPPAAAYIVRYTVVTVIVIDFDFRELIADCNALTLDVADDADELTLDIALEKVDAKLEVLEAIELIADDTALFIFADSLLILVNAVIMTVVLLAILLIEDAVLVAMLLKEPDTVVAIR